MAVNWGSLIFGGVDSSEYGIYLSGEGVYNAPERAIEMVDVPGRNGAVIIDQGHWNNIEVVYHAGVYGVNQAEMSEKLSAFRNAILSQVGYQRLSDSYHPEEYRMGAYVSGLEVSPASYYRHGEFDLTFNCKPQRWLVDGELFVPVESGDVLQNPTDYDSSPLLRIKGYGNINFNGYDIDINSSDPLGRINVSIGNKTYVQFDSDAQGQNFLNTFSKNINIKTDRLIPGDRFIISADNNRWPYRLYNSFSIYTSDALSYPISNLSYSTNESWAYVDVETTGPPQMISANVAVFKDNGDPISFQYGTPLTYTYTVTFSAKMRVPTQDGTVYRDFSFDHVGSFIYDGDHTLTIENSLTNFNGTVILLFGSNGYKEIYIKEPIIANSTMPAYGEMIVDCDLGEAYKVVNGDLVPLNSLIDLGSDLPTLAPGINQLTADGTISDLKIAPRWWKL